MNTPTGPSAGITPEPRTRWSWKKRIGVSALGVFGGLVVIGGLGAAFGSHTPAGHPAAAPVTATAPASTAPATTAPATTPPVTTAPATTAPAAPAAVTTPAAPPADQIIARFNGTGMGTTGEFTVPADGNWHLSWAYTNGSLFAGQPENFAVSEYDASGNLINILVNALAVGDGTPTATPVYADSAAGSPVHFQVNTEDSSWSLVPVSGTS